MKINCGPKPYSSLAAIVTILIAMSLIPCLSGCGGMSALGGHQEALGNVMEDEYVIPKKPIDRHYIGCAWSKQFGPVEDPLVADILIRKEKSFNDITQDFAYKRGFGLGGQTIVGPKAEAGISASRDKKAKLGGVEIIKPVSLADIPFEPKVPYITEALRLANFAMKKEKAFQAKINATAGTKLGSGTALAETGSSGKTKTEGEGLIVAYKLHTINSKTYEKEDSGSLPLELNKLMEFPKSQLYIKAELKNIEAGGKKSLPRNLIWSCLRADAKSRNMIAAWLVRLKSTDPRKKSLTIAFPAFPKIEDCYTYNSTIFSRIDPLTDKIHRQKVNVTIFDSEVSDSLEPESFEARISVIDESFNIKLVKPGDLQ
jgi:hypothetical protein